MFKFLVSLRLCPKRGGHRLSERELSFQKKKAHDFTREGADVRRCGWRIRKIKLVQVIAFFFRPVPVLLPYRRARASARARGVLQQDERK